MCSIEFDHATLDKIISKSMPPPLDLSALIKFASSRYLEENVVFLAAVCDYRRDADNGELRVRKSAGKRASTSALIPLTEKVYADDMLLLRAKTIVNRFILSGAPEQINISSSMRGSTLEDAQGVTTARNAFDAAAAEVRFLIEDNLSLEDFAEFAARNIDSHEVTKGFLIAELVLLLYLQLCGSLWLNAVGSRWLRLGVAPLALLATSFFYRSISGV